MTAQQASSLTHAYRPHKAVFCGLTRLCGALVKQCPDNGSAAFLTAYDL